MFYDFNHGYTDDHVEAKRRLVASLRLGYGCIAHNHEVRNRSQWQSLNPTDLPDVKSMIQISNIDLEKSSRLTEAESSVVQLRRVTFVVDNADEAQMLMQTSKVKKVDSFDLIACCPCSLDALERACENMEIDLISLDLSLPLVLNVKQSLIKKALSRGLHFEVCYYPHLFLGAREHHNFCAFMNKYSVFARAKGIILSSGCSEAKCLRSPYDVINMATFLGFSPKQAMQAVSDACAATVERARIRRMTAQTFLPRSMSTDDSDARCSTPEAKRSRLEKSDNSQAKKQRDEN